MRWSNLTPIVVILGIFFGSFLTAHAITAGTPITVPSAPGYGYALQSTTTGAYVATTTGRVIAGTNVTVSGGPLYGLGADLTINATGGSGTPAGSSGQLQYNGAGSFAAVSTTTETLGSEFSYSGTHGALVGGASGTLTLSTNGTALSKLMQAGANTILGNATGATANVTAFATSTLGIAIADTTGTLTAARGGTGVATLSGIAKGNGTSPFTVAANGTDYTLITANSCGAGQHVSAVTAAGVITCSADTGAGGTGLATTSPITSGGALWYSGAGAGFASTIATTTFTPSAEFTVGGAIGALLGGSNSTLALATNGVALTKLAQIAANSILGNITGGTANVTAFATSSLGVALSDTTGTLAVNRGGTGVTSFTANQILYTNAAGTGLLSTASSTLFGAGTPGYVWSYQNGAAGWFATSTSGGAGTNYLTSSGANTYLNTGSRLQAPAIDATSTTATSTITNALTIGASTQTTSPYLRVGTTTPSYGYFKNDIVDFGADFNDYVGVEAYNNNAGNCADAEFDANGDGATLTGNFTAFMHTSTGYNGTGCPNGTNTSGFHPNSTAIFDPNGYMDFGIASTTAAFEWFAGGFLATNKIAVLTSAGNLGIGTTTPDANLTVTAPTGKANGTPIADFNYTTATNVVAKAASISSSTVPQIFVSASSSPASAFSGHSAFISKGASATTTVDIGELGDTTSKSCFNFNTAQGAAGSYYFTGTTQIIENHYCNP